MFNDETGKSLQNIAQTMTQVAWTALPDGRLDFLNDAGRAYTGLQLEQSLEWGWGTSFSAVDFVRLKTQFAESYEKNADFLFECKMHCSPAKAKRLNSFKIVAFRDAEGKIERWFGICSDIDAVKILELSDHQHTFEVRLQQVIDSIPGPIWWKDCDSNYLGCNIDAARKAGLKSPSEIVGKTDYDLHWKKNADGFHAGDRVVMTTEKNFHELQCIEFGDKSVWYDTYKVPFFDSHGKIAGTVGSSMDVTSLIRLTEQREDFMASLAHDLKVPIIGAIRAFEVLSEGLVGPLSSDQKSFVKKLHQSHHHLLSLIKNMLQVLRYEASADVLTISKCNLTRICQSCVFDLQSLSQDKNLMIKESFPKDCIVMADALAVERLMMNLVGNAIKFTPRFGLITVSIVEQDSTVLISVEDSGAGINKEDQTQLFQRFWQGGDVKKYAAETGLGLYLCRQIAQGHGGSIAVESVEGCGAKFTVTLPRKGPEGHVTMRLEG